MLFWSNGLASMMTRDEILDAISIEGFFIRHTFYRTLDSFTHRLADGTGEKIKLAWPDALSVLSPLDWNNAYHMTMVVKVARENRPVANPNGDHNAE